MPSLRPGPILLLVAIACAGVGEEGYEKPGRARLGIGMTETSLPAQERNGLEVQQGVQVAWVFPGTAAAQLGIRPGDVILAVDGEAIHGLGHMVDTVTSRSAGDPAEVIVARDGQRLSLGSAPLSGWPPGMSIPRVDPEYERQVADQQRGELARRQAAVDDLRRQLDETKRAVAERAAQPRDPALAEGLAALVELPPWRLDLRWRSPDAPVDAVAEAPAATGAAPARAAEPPWRLEHRFDSSAVP